MCNSLSEVQVKPIVPYQFQLMLPVSSTMMSIFRMKVKTKLSHASNWTRFPYQTTSRGKLIRSTLRWRITRFFFENPRAAEVLNMYHVSILKLASVLWHSTDVNFGIFIIFCLTSIRVNGIIFQEKNACSPWKKKQKGIPKKLVTGNSGNFHRSPSTGFWLGKHPPHPCHQDGSPRWFSPNGDLHCVSSLLGLWWDSLDLQPDPSFHEEKKTPVGFPERHP